MIERRWLGRTPFSPIEDHRTNLREGSQSKIEIQKKNPSEQSQNDMTNESTPDSGDEVQETAFRLRWPTCGDVRLSVHCFTGECENSPDIRYPPENLITSGGKQSSAAHAHLTTHNGAAHETHVGQTTKDLRVRRGNKLHVFRDTCWIPGTLGGEAKEYIIRCIGAQRRSGYDISEKISRCPGRSLPFVVYRLRWSRVAGGHVRARGKR